METLLQQLIRGKALLFIIILGIGGNFQNGYHLTELSSPSPFVQAFINSSWSDRYNEPPPPQTVTMIWSLIVSLYAIGGLCGAFSVRFISRLLGRKNGMIFSSCIVVAGALIMFTSKTAKSFEMIIAARILYGFAAGIGGSFHIMYLGEISPKKIRGRVTLTSTNFLSIGKLFGQLFGLSEILGREDLWNVLLCASGCFSLLQVIVLPFLPDSPRHLFIEKKDQEACRKALQSLWGPGDYKEEMDEMLIEQMAIEATPPKGPLQLLVDKNNRWQLVTMCTIFLLNQFAGISSLTTFSYDIFLEVGLPEDKIRYITLGLGLCDCITSMFASLLVERIGRRPMFWGGYSAICAIWVLVTVMLNLKDPGTWAAYVNLTLIILFIVFFYGGPGAVTNTLYSEIFLQTDRVSAFVIMGMLRWTTFAVLGLAFPFIINSLGSYSFVLFAASGLLGFLYTFFMLPETKGKTVLEISNEFKTLSLCGKFSRQEDMPMQLCL